MSDERLRSEILPLMLLLESPIMFARFAKTLLLLVCPLLLILAQPEPVRAQQNHLAETLKELKLTRKQKSQVFSLLQKYRGRYQTDEFSLELLKLLTPEQLQVLEKLRAKVLPDGKADDLTIELDIPYLKRDGVEPKLLSLDIYRKKEAQGKLPVLVMIHGGGWRIGDKSNRATGIDKGRHYADQGFVYVSINYRLSPAVTHPAHIEDVAAAVAWIHDHIAEYGGDPETIFVMGHSAGAHLAALVATDERRLKQYKKPLSIIDGVILLDGAGYDVSAQMKLNKVLTASMYRAAFTDDPAVQRDASPLQHVAAGKSIPPFLIIPIASRPDSRAQSENLAKAINAADGSARVYVAEDKTHSTVNTEIGQPGDKPTAEILKFVNEIQLKK